MPSELLHSRLRGQTCAALREGGATVELHHERAGESGVVGDVLHGRVTRILPGIQSAFVDIGLEREAFLNGSDLLLPGRQAPGAPIQDRLRAGRDLVVQITREAGGTKGARVTCHVSLAGRYLVHLPLGQERVVSKRIADRAERARLEEILARLPQSLGGFVVRTAGQGVGEAAFEADAALLAACWKGIAERAAIAPPPALLHADEALLLRLLRDAPRDGLDLVVVDDAEDRERAVGYLGALDPVLAAKVRLHTGPGALLEAHGVDRDVERALRSKVWLRSGAFIVIQKTEALVAVDVNSGKFLGRERPEETALRTNLEAAAEIARQLRLRDLGGIVVIDFIDMERAENRRLVLEALEESLAKDRARTKVLGLSALGLVELTRRKRRRDLAASLTEACPACSGTGRVKTPL